MEKEAHVVFITGAAGYVGLMLMREWAKREDVKLVIGLDKEKEPEILSNNPKTRFIQANTSSDVWQDAVAAEKPDIVIHAAWQIRTMYGKGKWQWLSNVVGSEKVFKFAFETSSVKCLVHFSTAAIYGAYASNSLYSLFKENDPIRKTDYLYAVEKAAAEAKLNNMVLAKPERLKVFVVRPAAITGPRGRSMHHRFGLQSSLSGTLRGSVLYSIIRALVFMVPVTKAWVRQFVHEDDVVDIVTLLAFEPQETRYETFNLAPPGKPVFPKDMAEAVGKKVLWVYPWMVRLAFFLAWHVTLGKVPTSKGSWRFYSYPVLMDGSKASKYLHFNYRMDSKEAFTTQYGRYGVL